MASVSIRNLTRSPIPGAVSRFSRVVEKVLSNYDISLVFVGERRARALNKRLRNKTYIPNVLSTKLGRHSGEVIICTREAKRQAPRYDMSLDKFVLYLFIHGTLHISGRLHGATMERCERELLATFATG